MPLRLASPQWHHVRSLPSPRKTGEDTMDYADYLKGISFLFIQPHMARQEDGWYAIVRPDGRRVRLLEIPETLLDVANTRLPVREFDMKCRLRPLCKIPRMSTFAIG